MNKVFRLGLLALLNILCISTFGGEVEQLSDTLRTVALDEVVATGTGTAADVRLLPVTVSVVGENVLTERMEPNVLPTLTEQVPGMFVTQRGVLGYAVSTGGSGGIKMRGVGGTPNTDVLVLVDGLPHSASAMSCLTCCLLRQPTDLLLIGFSIAWRGLPAALPWLRHR